MSATVSYLFADERLRLEAEWSALQKRGCAKLREARIATDEANACFDEAIAIEDKLRRLP